MTPKQAFLFSLSVLMLGTIVIGAMLAYTRLQTPADSAYETLNCVPTGNAGIVHCDATPNLPLGVPDYCATMDRCAWVTFGESVSGNCIYTNHVYTKGNGYVATTYACDNIPMIIVTEESN